MGIVEIECAYCGAKVLRYVGHVNRSRKQGRALYCNRVCSGLGRRKHLTNAEKKERKRLYDNEYRKKNRAILKVKKAKYYRENHDREKEREYRKKNMARHVEYCRRPEYREYKRRYDRVYNAKCGYGELWEIQLALLDLDDEVKSRANRYEIYSETGRMNLSTKRRRESGQTHR